MTMLGAEPRRSFGGVRGAGLSFVVKALLTVAIGTAAGLWATRAVVHRWFIFGGVIDGAWKAFPTVGSPLIDPYARAIVARIGFAPVGADEGLAFFATNDAQGQMLSGRCDYVIESGELSARFWSLGLFDRSGRVVVNAANRYALTSQDVVRTDSRFAIRLSPDVQPDNWLPTPAAAPFTLVMTLYEGSGGTAVATAADTALPAIRRERCRP